MGLLRRFIKPSPLKIREDAGILGYALHASGRVEAIKQGSGMYGTGFGEGAFSETAFGTNVALSQSGYGWAAAYSQSCRAYRCIEVRASAVHRMPYSVYDKRTKQALPEHPLAIALKRNRQHPFKHIERSQLLYGETFFEYIVNDYGYVSDLYCLNNLGMAVIVGAGRIMEYSYTALQGGHAHNFRVDQVAFMKTFNPFNDLRGMSPTEVIMDQIAVEKDVTRVVRAFYANDTRVGILMIPKTNLTPGDSERFLAEWKKQNQGINKSGKPNLMPFDMTVERIQESASLDDMELRQSMWREIAAGYGVPMSMAGAYDEAKYQTLPEQRKSFYEETVIPECDNIAEFINSDVMPVMDDSGDAEFRFDYMSILALTEDAQKKNDIYSNRLISGLITRAEAREALGHPVRDSDHVYYIPTGATVVPDDELALVTPTANTVDDTVNEQTNDPATTAPQVAAPKPAQLPSGKPPVPTPASTPPTEAPKSAQSIEPSAKVVHFVLAKASVPCYVILSLANNPAIAAIQNKLKMTYPDVQWATPDTFHVTMVYALSASDPKLLDVKSVLPKSINPFNFEVGPLTAFEVGDDGTPVVLTVQATDTLTALQAGLYGSFESLGLEMSEYSDPKAWQPHITLGYVDSGKPIPTYDGKINVRVDALICSIGEGDSFRNVYVASTKTIAPPQSTPLDELNAWEKKALNNGAMKATGFVCYVIDKPTQDVVRAALHEAGKAATKAVIRAVFAEARKALQPPAVMLDYWRHYDALMDELGRAWITDYMARAFEQLEPTIVGAVMPDQVQAALDAYHPEFMQSWMGTDTAPGPLIKLIQAGMGAAQEALYHHSAANPHRPVSAKDIGLVIDWNLLATEARQFAQTYLYSLIKGIDDTTRKFVQDTVSQWIESGASVDDLKLQLRQVFTDPIRADAIAESESTRAYVEGAKDRYHKADVQKVKLSRLSDSLVCDVCLPLEGTVVLLSVGWISATGASWPPFHARCRHWIIPADDEED